MSDFLTDLIQRQEKPQGAVRPRLPSMFEAAGEQTAKSPDLLTELTVEQDAPAPAPTAAPPRTEPAPAPHREPRVQEIAEVAPAFAPARALPVRPQPLPPLERIAEREVPPAAPRRAAKPEAPPAQAPRATEETVIQPVVERRVTRRSPIVEESEIVDAPRTISTRRTMESFAPQPVAPAASVRPAPQPSAAEAIAAVASPFAPPPPQTRQQQREARREPREQQPQAHAQPSIHVTIGRLEIRASEEREPRARGKDAPSSVMTLDAYLKSRTKR